MQFLEDCLNSRWPPSLFWQYKLQILLKLFYSSFYKLQVLVLGVVLIATVLASNDPNLIEENEVVEIPVEIEEITEQDEAQDRFVDLSVDVSYGLPQLGKKIWISEG